MVLTDDREGKHADGKTILTCIAIRNICRGEQQPNIAVECRNPNNRHHLQKAGADEIISSDELGLRLLARSALFHGMTRVYQELLTVGRDANEMYLLPAPEGLVGKDFVELAGMFVRHRDDRRSCLLIGIQRGDEMHLNPIGGEAGPLKPDDQLILLSRVFLEPSEPLPTDPPVDLPAGRGLTARDRSPASAASHGDLCPMDVSDQWPLRHARMLHVSADPFKLTMLIFAVIAFMYFTGEVLKPLALSVLLSFALAPAVRLLERLRPAPGRRGRPDGRRRPGAPGRDRLRRRAAVDRRWPIACPITRRTSRPSSAGCSSRGSSRRRAG